MFWYSVPMAQFPFTSDPGSELAWCVTISGARSRIPASSVLHHKNGDTGALLGCRAALDTPPPDWIPLTLTAATASFTTTFGRAPTPDEVF